MQTAVKVTKQDRQNRIRQLLGSKDLGSQQEVVEALAGEGISATQATVSRDLDEMGAVKVEGRYRLPRLRVPRAAASVAIKVDTAGDNLAVIRTPPGQASMVAFTIDERDWGEIVGTLAGDDTIFVATRSAEDQRKAVQRIYRLFAGS